MVNTLAGGHPDDRAVRPLAPTWIERLTLTNVRTYSALTVHATAGPIVLTGHNGAGKTNLLEAISLLAPGQGLRSADFADIARADGDGSWAVAARVVTADGAVDIGTGLRPANGPRGRAGRIVRVDGVTQPGSGRLADLVEMVWLTPQMDGLFTGPASERRRFLDRLVMVFDPASRARAGTFERAMRERNRLLADGNRSNVRLAPLELMMAETGVAMAATRAEVVAQLQATITARREHTPHSPFPWASLALEGPLETGLALAPAVEIEDQYIERLAQMRERDAAAGRALDGPHRSDLVVRHGPKDANAARCSTGEQKALMVGIVLAHAELMAARRGGAVPILLLDEIAAHFDQDRRAALFDEICRLRAQCWMSGTDEQAFAALRDRALFLEVGPGKIVALQRDLLG